LECYELDLKIRSDISLNRGISRVISGETISSIHFDSYFLSNGGEINESVFVECMFSHCEIPKDRISNCTFVNCSFYDCNVVGEFGESVLPSTFVACNDDSEQVLIELGELEVSRVENGEVDETERYVLEQFWPMGRPNFQPKKAIRTLYKGFNSSQYKEVSHAIERLRKKGIILINGDLASLVTSKLTEIKIILGR